MEVFDGERLRRLLTDRGMSQSELARRVGISQASVFRLVKGDAYGSKHLHKIARELRTTPAYLAGEIDDPDEGAPPPPAVQPVHFVTMQVALPPERALARMFEGLLRVMDRNAPLDEQALLLAQRLPIGLAQLRDLLPATAQLVDATQPEAPTIPVREPQ